MGKTCTFLRLGFVIFFFNLFFGTPGSLIIASGSEGGFCKGSLSSCMFGEITEFFHALNTREELISEASLYLLSVIIYSPSSSGRIGCQAQLSTEPES